VAGSRKVATKCVAFAVLSIVLLTLLYNTMVDQPNGDVIAYRAKFVEVSGLRTGDDVRVAGVKVGTVERVEVDGDRAVVTLVVQRSHALTDTTGLVLRYQNLIGQRYLAVVPGKATGARLGSGATIPIQRTSPGFDLTALLNGFRPLFAVLQPADINALSESVIKVLQGEGGTVAGLLQETTELTNYLADRGDLFHQVAANLTPVLKEVSGNGQVLQDTVHQLALLTTGLAKDRRTFGSSIDELAELLGRTNSLVTEVRAPLRRDIALLRRVARLYAANSEKYGQSFAYFGSVLETLGRTTSYRSAINTLMCQITLRSGDADLRVGTANDRHSEVCR